MFPHGYPRRGEVYWVDFGIPKGSEQGGRRPAAVVSNDISNRYSPVVIVAAITTRVPRKDYPWNVPLPAGVAGLKEPGTLLGNQLRTVARDRLLDYAGTFDGERSAAVDAALSVSLGLTQPGG